MTSEVTIRQSSPSSLSICQATYEPHLKTPAVLTLPCDAAASLAGPDGWSAGRTGLPRRRLASGDRHALPAPLQRHVCRVPCAVCRVLARGVTSRPTLSVGPRTAEQPCRRGCRTAGPGGRHGWVRHLPWRGMRSRLPVSGRTDGVFSTA